MLHISWEAQSTDLQPINKFVVVVAQAPAPIRNALDRFRRQAEAVGVPSLTESGYWEYETDENSLTLELSDPSKTYTVSVCAVNQLGRECTDPPEVVHPVESPKEPAISAGLQGGPDSGGSKKKTLSSGLVIAIAVVVPVMMLALCAAVIFAAMICKYYNRSKDYYPARQGITQGIFYLLVYFP